MTVDEPPGAAPVPVLELDLLGGASPRFGGVALSLVQRKSKALLAYLALTAGGRESRERLVGLLWSGSDEDRARASLRQALHELREAFHAVGFDGFVTGKLDVDLDPRMVRVDVLEVLADAEAGRVHPLLRDRSRLLDDLLKGVDSVDEVFSTWVLGKRQLLQQRLTTGLERALRSGAAAGGDTDEVARALIALDPTHEEAVRSVMQARAAVGDVGGAMSVYKSLWDVLEQEYDVEPSRETADLAARIRLEQPQSESPPAPQPTAGRNRTRLVVAVSGFDASGAKPDSRYLIDGFRRDLIATLVRFREWMIRDAQGATTAVAAGAWDEYVVEASGFEFGGEVRLALVLRDRQSGEFLWSERVTVAPEKWLEVQLAIVRRLAAALNVHISLSRFSAISQSSAVEPLAYDMWLRGQAEIFTWTKENLERNLERFRDIVARFPNFAPAYSTLAQMQNARHFMLPGTSRDADTIASALSFASEAVRIDPVDTRGHLALGWAQAMAGRHDRAAIHHAIAYDLNENDTWTLMSAALGAAARGEHDKARALGDLSIDLSLTPTSTQWSYQAQIAFIRRDYEAARHACEQAPDHIPSAPGWHIATLGHLGLVDEARVLVDSFVERIAQRWIGPNAATPAAIAAWFLDLFPFADREDRAHLARGLAAAGMPIDPAELE